MKNHWLDNKKEKELDDFVVTFSHQFVQNERLFGFVHADASVDYDPCCNYPVCKGTLVGSVFNDNTLVQTFTVDQYNDVNFTNVGVPITYLINAEFNSNLGLFTGQFNVMPNNTYVEVCYEYSI